MPLKKKKLSPRAKILKDAKLEAEHIVEERRKLNAIRSTGGDISDLEKAIYHSFKMMTVEDHSGKSKLLYNGHPVKGKSETFDLKELFDKIVSTYKII